MIKRGFLHMAVAVLLLAALIPALPTHAQSGSAPYWPTEGWRTSTPEEQGMNSETLAAMLREIQEKGYPVDHILVIRNGYVVLDASINPARANEQHNLYSATNSVTSVLVGIAMQEGYIESVEQPVLDIFSNRTFAEVNEAKQALKLEHLLTMTADLTFATDSMEKSGDWVQYALDRHMSLEPGQMALFFDSSAHLLMAVVGETTGASPLDYAREKLFTPLGITDVAWPSDPQGIPLGYSELSMTPHDLAKIGYLYLNGGEWDGQQIVSPDWVAASTAVHSRPWDTGFGYLWWIFPDENAYAAFGWLGQWLIVDLERDLIAVFLSDFDTGLYQWRPMDYWFPENIQGAVESDDPLPQNPDGVALLNSYMTALAEPPPQPVSPLPDLAKVVDGQTYVLTENVLGWRTLALTFGESEALLTVDTGQTVLEIPVGLDGVYRTPPVSVNQVFGDNFVRSYVKRDCGVALRGRWKDDTTFVFEVRYLGSGENVQLDLKYEGDSVKVYAQELAARAFYSGTIDNRTSRFEGTLQ